jgi:pimeloyl-ACP methyl ester carboxylesterase
VLPAPPGFRHAVFAAEVPLHYIEGPRNGPDLVLLHGMARDWNSFSVLLPDLTSRFHLLIPDLRGHGSSGRAPGGYSIPRFASDISALLRKIAPEGTVIFGHSLGAMVGMFVAGSAACTVNALIVGDSMISPENLRDSPYHSLFSQLRALILRGGSQQELASGIARIEVRLPGFDEAFRLGELAGNTPEVLLEWARSAICTDPEVLMMSLDASAFQGWEPTNILPQIKCSVLLLQANPDLDALLTDSDVELALRLMPRVEHVRFPLLGHALFMQRPKPVLMELDRFLVGQGLHGK